MDTLKVFSVLFIIFQLVKSKCPWKGSTLCLKNSPLLISSGVSKEQKKVIVAFHNELRSQAVPPASDLMVLIWDEKIAEVAQKLANQCKLYHDKDRRVPGYGVHIGQNVASGYTSWKEAIKAWYSEKKAFKFWAKNSMIKVGHFTQILYEKTSRIGCGFGKCKNDVFYVCNYASGQLNYAFEHPYKPGKRCGQCPKTCKNGLCDCKGKLCLNNGQINPNECTCKCEKNYSGENCETLHCEKKDFLFCGLMWPSSYCLKYSNVPALCPRMCGICP